ncbi:MAG TPA: phosphatidylglycerophosphatase A [Candidatus Polarisedimenticolia bacterium]|nr:phosphatidylglycerophosphatase A [Candidatus Polarisedimenticolia bacterium]
MPQVAEARRTPAWPAAWALATFCGVGHSPVASGTVATAVAVPVHVAAWMASGPWGSAGLALLLTFAGVAASGALERGLGYHDPSEAVVDEVAGFLLTMLFVPPTLWTCLAGFLLFRALDILKPWPASRLERLPGGWGIMADDVACGLIGNLVMHAGLALLR